MNSKILILFWLILVATALCIGAGAIYLLSHEEERLENAWKQTAAQQAHLLADTLSLAISDVENTLADELLLLPTNNLITELETWNRQDPLVRNVFLWQSGQLQYPDKKYGITGEQQSFITRFRAILSVDTPPWKQDRATAEEKRTEQPAESTLSKRLRTPALRRERISATEANATWVPWFHDDRMYILGYTYDPGHDLAYGVELEVMAILARLIPVFNMDTHTDYTFVLTDNKGRIVHSTGSSNRTEDQQLINSIPIGPLFPHWQVRVYCHQQSGALNSLLMPVAITLSGILVLSVLVCSSLLFWLAHKSQTDARRKTGFVSNVSHELKTPLTTIRMYAEILGENRIRDAKKKEHYLQVIIEQSQRLTRLINNVLDFGRLEQHRRTFNLTPQDIIPIINAVLQTQRHVFEKNGMTLSTTWPEHPVIVQIDRDAIEQVLLNLLDNAMKYASSGKRLFVEWENTEHFHKLIIRDNGPGIPYTQRRRIFEKFYRIDNSLAATQSGCGLGLSISRKLLRGMGGDLVLSSPPQGGAAFIIQLPRTAP